MDTFRRDLPGMRLLFFGACLLFMIVVPGISLAQQLDKGDIAFTGFNADANSGFAVVALRDLPANTIIFFNASGWNGSSFDNFNKYLEWNTGASVISAGTVITFNDLNTISRTASIGSLPHGREINLSSAGEVVFAYTAGNNEKDGANKVFLAAISTESHYTDGNNNGIVDGTGLTIGKGAISLKENYDVGEYNGGRSGDTKHGYIKKIADTDDNWDQANGNGDQSGQVLPFDKQPFAMVSPPAVQFAASAGTVNEDDGSYQLAVKLSTANNTTVSVDVVFLPNASTAKNSDIGGYTTQTVHFSNSAPDGTTKHITIHINDDNQFEAKRMAIFQLQNISAGSIVKPKAFTLTIHDNEKPPVVFNEILADPPSGMQGDANNDGTRDGSDDEFLELVNTSTHKIDISGWKLSDDGAATIRHVFPAGTVLSAHQAIVVFGGGNPTGAFGGAIVQTASSGSLSLNNSGDIPTLKNGNGNMVAQVLYGDQWGATRKANKNQSLTRFPDVTGGLWKEHSQVPGSHGALFSPGTKVDGEAFGGGFATTFRGKEGWRFVAVPTQNTTFKDLVGSLWTQGIPNSDAPSVKSAHSNIRSWNESNSIFQTISNMNDNMVPGKGYIVYVYQDDDLGYPGIQGGFPKTISTDNSQNGSVNAAVSSHDKDGNGSIDGNEGWNLLGNPYGTDISVSGVLNALRQVNSNLNGNVYIWDPNKGNGNGGYVTKSTGTIAPFQAFFVRYTQKGVSGSAGFSRSALTANHGTSFLGKANMASTSKQIKLFLGNGQKFDTYEVQFKKGAKISEDRQDGYKLFSLNLDPIELYSTVGDGVKLAKNVVPPARTLKENTHIPLLIEIPAPGAYKFRWSGDINDLPGQVKLYLIDHKTGRKINMVTSENYQFKVVKRNRPEEKTADKDAVYPPATSGKAARHTDTAIKSRFELVLATSSSNPNDDIEKSEIQKNKLFPNYPNPFSSQTTIKFQLKKSSDVTIVIYNIVGQKIATLVEDKMMPAGIQQVPWQPSGSMPSGVYICWVKAGDKVMTQKMTYIK